LRASWHLRNGLFFGGGYALLADIEPSAAITFSVTRHPIELHGGFRWRPWDELRLDGMAAVSIDLLERRTAPTPPGLAQTTDAAGDSLRVSVAVGARGRVEWGPVPPIAFYALGGIDILLNNFSYIVAGDPAGAALRPSSPRPVVEAGFVYYP
jgi:hypothetical protein